MSAGNPLRKQRGGHASAWSLVLVAFAAAALMFAFEGTKQFLFPHVTIWQSHLTTICFATLLTVLAVHLLGSRFSTLNAELVAYIEERKRDEAALRERTHQLESANAQLRVEINDRRRAEDRFRAFFETVAVGTAELDLRGRFVQVNQRLCQITGYSQEELLGMTPPDLTHPEDRGHDAEQIIAYLHGRLPVYDTEKRYVRKDDRVIWVHVVAAMIRDDVGNMLCSAGIIQDITERKTAEQALLRSEKLATLGRMAATIAHEINNPLEAVMNLLFLAQGSNDLSESTRHLLETADGELRRVAHITRQSLGFYRESNAPALTSVSTVLDSVLDVLKNRIKAKHAIIDKQWNEDVQIIAVGGELRQVFSNVVSNSLDAIGERGTVKVRVSAGNDHVRITVADNGSGIPPSIRHHIFEPFFTTKDTLGTGLGLWVSQQIVEKHGGRVSIRSNTNGVRRGTTVSVVLPAGRTPVRRSQPAAA